jgi:ribonuclease HII
MERPDFSIETRLLAGGIWPVAGTDEAGRGPLAGPVSVAAVVLDPSNVPQGLDDSKRLSRCEREELFEIITKSALAIAVAFAPAQDIDAINIRAASLRGMAQAVRALAVRPAHVLVDGRDLPRDLGIPAQAIIGGDGVSASIAAASIIAKVARDRLMARLDQHCPGYDFARHAGYATARHRAALVDLGLSTFHRRSFRSGLA